MDETLELWKKAGKLAAEALEYGKSLLVEKANVFEIASKIESFIESKGGKVGFPVQISKNSIGAHYTPEHNDSLCLESGDIVKLDLGAQIDGYVGDNATTVEIKTNNYKDLIEASKNALEAAIKICKPGVKVCEIGKAINESVAPTGFKAIRNLCGHKIDRYILHSNISIPNYDNNDQTVLEEGMVIAIEPHVSNGMGLIKEGKPSGNYRMHNPKQVRDPITREILDHIKKEFHTLPFARRHLVKKFPLAKVNYALSNLEKQNIIYQYAQLPEKQDGCKVSQHEHTIYISDPPIILTK